MRDEEHERIRDPQQELEPEHLHRVDVLADQEREEDVAEADVDVAAPDRAAAHYEEVVRLIDGIFRGDEVDLEGADLAADERAALAALEEVVRGEDRRTERMIYAEDRLAMLNDALAVLQPTLALGLVPELAALRDTYDQLAEGVAGLRDQLEALDGAQEEIFAHEWRRPKAADEGDDGDDGDDGDADEGDAGEGDADADAPPRRSTLIGDPDEPAVEPPPRRSTLTD